MLHREDRFWNFDPHCSSKMPLRGDNQKTTDALLNFQTVKYRLGNPRALEAWRRAAVDAGDPTSWSERLQPTHRLAETWWLGLRLAEGLDAAAAQELAGVDPSADPCLPTAVRLAREGLLVKSRGRWHLTDRGLELADAVSAELLAAGRA